jgi:hypothetical protein
MARNVPIYPQLNSALLNTAEKVLVAFFGAANQLFDAQQAERAAEDWIHELEAIDFPEDVIPFWCRANNCRSRSDCEMNVNLKAEQKHDSWQASGITLHFRESCGKGAGS